MNHQLGRTIVAAAAVLCLAAKAEAVVVVAEDFFYNEVTKSLTDFSGFTRQNYGGGQNASGFWDDRWLTIGGTTILGEDAVGPGLEDNPHTAVVTEIATAASLQRPYVPTGAAASATTLYFAGDFKIDNVATPSIFAELGVLSPAAALGTPSLSFGITDSASSVPGTFFAKAGTTVVTADAVADPDNALVSGAWHRIVAKLEIGAVAGPGDYDGNGQTDGNDFLIWQRTLGSAAVPPGSGADGNSDGTVNGPDLAVWRSGFGGLERLTVYFNPTGVETTNATVLTVTGNLVGSNILDTTLSRVISLNGNANILDSGRPHYIDNLAIGTTWADVATVNVPRLTLEVNTTTGQTRLINNTSQSIPLAYYEILSTSGALKPSGAGSWNSLDDQNTSGGAWLENSPSANQLIESNFTGSTTIASGGGTLLLGGAFTVGGAQDLVARWGTKEGFDGLLNVANVVYVTGAAAPVPEPATWGLLAAGLVAAAFARKHPLMRQPC